MPFKQINVNEQIIEKRKNDTEFDALWQESRNEYKLLPELYCNDAVTNTT